MLIYCNSLNVEPTDTVSFPNQPPKQADGVDDVVVRVANLVAAILSQLAVL